MFSGQDVRPFLNSDISSHPGAITQRTSRGAQDHPGCTGHPESSCIHRRLGETEDFHRGCLVTISGLIEVSHLLHTHAWFLVLVVVLFLFAFVLTAVVVAKYSRSLSSVISFSIIWV